MDTENLDTVNAVLCILSQADAVISSITDSAVHAKSPVNPEALYGVKTLLHVASERLSQGATEE